VLLIDGDLRLPRCHEALNLPLEPGLSSYLAGQVMSQPIQATKVKNLSFIAAGRAVQNPTELLTSWRMWQLLTGARDHFDFVVIDSPPLLPVSDGLLLANVADGVLLVVESKRSREQQKTGASVLGAVLNRCTVEHGYYDYTTWSGDSAAADAPINVGEDELSAAKAE
jgi:capsular exopolysaccharide synthesis family protein